jgi:hypothetical protein
MLLACVRVFYVLNFADLWVTQFVSVQKQQNITAQFIKPILRFSSPAFQIRFPVPTENSLIRTQEYYSSDLHF